MTPQAKAIMVQGCTSDAGKSYLAAALCRILSNQGVRVAPFKAQNMSNNAGVTPTGLEMGRAQLVQAQAARVVPDVRMNPVLLKPEADTRSQVVLLGQANPALSALPWRERKPRLWPHVQEALHSLMDEYDVLVIEGAGSPAEINLQSSDIVNMRVAHAARARVLLAADIDRGGAFAHLLGTWHCLPAADRALLGGFILNKFRGDPALLAPAPQWLEKQTGVPVLGTVPMLSVPLPEEDSLSSTERRTWGQVGVVRLPHIANTDEFAPLGEHLRWVTTPAELSGVQAVILPGSKSTAADLAWLRATGLAAAITALADHKPLLGICGGLQMLGRRISDPHGVEASDSERNGTVDGLGLLDIHTELASQKTTTLTTFNDPVTGQPLSGYEIHHGQTRSGPGVHEQVSGLLWQCGQVRGTYLHGLLDNPAFLQQFLSGAGLPLPAALPPLDWRLDTLATQVQAALQWDTIAQWL